MAVPSLTDASYFTWSGPSTRFALASPVLAPSLFSFVNTSFQDFKMFYDVKFGRKKEISVKDADAKRLVCDMRMVQLLRMETMCWQQSLDLSETRKNFDRTLIWDQILGNMDHKTRLWRKKPSEKTIVATEKMIKMKKRNGLSESGDNGPSEFHTDPHMMHKKKDDFRRAQPDAIAHSAGDARVFKQRRKLSIFCFWRSCDLKRNQVDKQLRSMLN